MAKVSLPKPDYEFDVFLSYKRNSTADIWVTDYFLRHFTLRLGDALAREPKIFFDKKVIQAGQNWEEQLRSGLRKSKVLLAVCSSQYFYDSDYCNMEWYSFGGHGLTGGRVMRPRLPIRFNDGDHFPEEAKKTQQADFSDCNSIVPAFYLTDKGAVLYEQRVIGLAEVVAAAIRQAPLFDPKFPIRKPRPTARPKIGKPLW